MRPRVPSVTAPSSGASSRSPRTTGEVAVRRAISKRASETARTMAGPAGAEAQAPPDAQRQHGVHRPGVDQKAQAHGLTALAASHPRADEGDSHGAHA